MQHLFRFASANLLNPVVKQPTRPEVAIGVPNAVVMPREERAAEKNASLRSRARQTAGPDRGDAGTAPTSDAPLFAAQTRRFGFQLADLRLQLDHLIGIVGLLLRPSQLLAQMFELLFDHFQTFFRFLIHLAVLLQDWGSGVGGVLANCSHP